MQKKGQAQAASTLIAIIAALIVLYILFIPPAERQKILEGEDYVGVNGDGNGNITLFELDAPRVFSPEKEKKFEKDFPNVNLLLLEEGTALKSVDSLYTSRTIFSESVATTSFEIENLDDTKSVLLNFLVKDSKGRLIIKLNGNEVFNREIETININPIELKEFLREGANTLDFSVSSPGGLFWRKNRYALEDVMITGDVTRREGQEASLKFILTSAEKSNIEKARLRFWPSCKIGDVGALSVYFNGNVLYSAIPDCNNPVMPIEFSPEYFVVGENVLRFSTTKGRYLIEQIKISSTMPSDKLPTYYFQITRERYDMVKDEDADVILYMRFVDDEEMKEADIRINGYLTAVTQEEREFQLNINDFVEEGNNAIKIEPIESLEVVEMRVIYDEFGENGEDCSPKRYRKKCYMGDVWWYDACGDRYKVATICTRDEYCSDDRCVIR